MLKFYFYEELQDSPFIQKSFIRVSFWKEK